MMKTMSQQQLITASKDGDAAAFGELVDQYKTALVRHCYVIVRDSDVAQDIAQDSFIAAYRYIASYDETKAKFSTWLFKIGTNNALKYISSQAKTRPFEDDEIDKVPSPHLEPSQAAEHAELHVAVQHLPARYRAVVSMYYWEGMSYAEIADILYKPDGTIKVWLLRAKESLRKELES